MTIVTKISFPIINRSLPCRESMQQLPNQLGIGTRVCVCVDNLGIFYEKQIARCKSLEDLGAPGIKIVMNGLRVLKLWRWKNREEIGGYIYP